MRSKWSHVLKVNKIHTQHTFTEKMVDNVSNTFAAVRLSPGSSNGSGTFLNTALSSEDTLTVPSSYVATTGFSVSNETTYVFNRQSRLVNALNSVSDTLTEQSLSSMDNAVLGIGGWKSGINTSSNYMGGSNTMTEDITVVINNVDFSGDPPTLRIARLLPSIKPWDVIDTSPMIGGFSGNYNLTFTFASFRADCLEVY